MFTASVVPLVMAKRASGVNVQEIIEKADQLYHDNKVREAYEYLHQYKDVDNADVQWRLARLCYHMSNYYSDNHFQTKQFAQEGLGYAERSIQLDRNNHRALRVGLKSYAPTVHAT